MVPKAVVQDSAQDTDREHSTGHTQLPCVVNWSLCLFQIDANGRTGVAGYWISSHIACAPKLMVSVEAPIPTIVPCAPFFVC